MSLRLWYPAGVLISGDLAHARISSRSLFDALVVLLLLPWRQAQLRWTGIGRQPTGEPAGILLAGHLGVGSVST